MISSLRRVSNSLLLRAPWIVLLCGALLFVTEEGLAAPCPDNSCSMSDGNATLDVDHLYSDGVFSWEIDDIEQIGERQWFWVRVAGMSQEVRVDDQTENYTSSGFNLTSSDLSGNSVQINYSGRGLAISIVYTLTGGATASGESDLAWSVQITNTSGSALDVYWFDYADFDVQNAGNTEVATWLAPATIRQQDQTSGARLVYASSRTPSHYEIGPEYVPGVDTILDYLNDSAATTLGDTGSPTGPTGVEFALQYDFNALAAGHSVSYAVTVAVPEPHTSYLAVAAILALGVLDRLRRGHRGGNLSSKRPNPLTMR